MLITFVVVNRNNDRSLERLLKDIKRIDCEKEIILVDDCSDRPIAPQIKKAVNRILVNEVRSGIGISRNRGIDAATGEIIVVLDSDLELLRLDVDRIATLFHSHADVVGLSGDYHCTTNCWNAALDLRRSVIYRKKNEAYLYSAQDRYTTFSGGLCAIYKERLSATRQHANGYVACEDLLFQLELLNRGYRFAYAPWMQALHHHERSFEEAFKKTISEARGTLWLIACAHNKGLHIPSLESATAFPSLLLFAVVFGRPEFFLFELLPYFTALVVRPDRSSLRLLFVAALSCMTRLVCLPGLLFRSPRIETLKYVLVSGFACKLGWMRECLKAALSAAKAQILNSAVEIPLNIPEGSAKRGRLLP